MKTGLALAAALVASQAASAATNHVRFNTSLGNIEVTLRPDAAPNTVANFLGYVNRGDYDHSFIHRAEPNFVIQGGGFFIENGYGVITAGNPVANEFKISNTRGTLAMAKAGNNPNGATDQWFFNLADNSANLDHALSGFTVFGQAADQTSLTIIDAIAGKQVVNADDGTGNFLNLPVINYTGGSSINALNFIYVESIDTILAAGSPDYSISVPAAPLNIPSGTPGTVTVTVTPLNGYQGTVTLGCVRVPIAASCSFNPGQLTFASGGPAQTSTLTVNTSSTNTGAAMAFLSPGGQGGSRLAGGGAGAKAGLAALGLFGLGLVAAAATSRTRRRTRGGLALSGGLLIAVAGCSQGRVATPPGPYVIPIRGVDGTLSHPASLAVVVE